ncbi:Hydroxylamine reductase [Slackia heliotrinireducens]|uniref:Hydroxylamine reductase n=1 Tax=Slackia heliotrinireducens (strain ATCC 29202 / DSM 20476 / NCTC 11029 / RHS 1) TaxID=471855 RepID=C7N478_SLAHD|nr:hydroxylamine reductase [Slackia heliotrinireducens]ACV23814.1 hydroxylamine reductase [Slackia heliotrinireducens DSM 20476]VEH03501.1 Hydroxylamine reductase [Slackia heliotrinireducens]
MENMFCFQCEQTAGCTACTGKAGVCGKTAEVAIDQDELTGALIGLAATCKAAGTQTATATKLLVDGLFATVTNVNFDGASIDSLIERVHAETAAIAQAEGIEAAADYPLAELWSADEDIRSLKSLILFGLRGMAAYAYHARVLGRTDAAVDAFFVEALAALVQPGTMDDLLPLVLKVGEVNLTCMGMLDAANTETFGTPEPTEVTLNVEAGPFIVITGHDLYDLKLLLEQTEGKGINVYTHGEMLPAHAYPELKKFSHLKGNFGTAWQNQKREFDNLPAPVLFTTNCLMPPKDSYADRVFTTEMVEYPGTVHIGEDKDFTPVIEKALELGGFSEEQHFTGINGGDHVLTGFAQGTVLGVADTVVDAVKSGAIKHFFLVGGCDGARPGRNYFTDFVKATPDDTVVLTLACGKYRFNDLDLGTIGGLPRLMDVGQCNDAYSAIQIAVALANAFGCGVNELPLSMVLSWYEQKAVCILLTLLYLGITNIKLGPTLPAFVSPAVLDFLVEQFHIAPTTTVEADLAELLG